MNFGYFSEQTDYGPNPYIANIEQMAMHNQNFRTAVWTGLFLQMTLMCIPIDGEIGLEMHPDTDQLIRVEQGKALVKIGRFKDRQDFQRIIHQGNAVFVPAGSWHNLINVGEIPLKLSSVYAPPNHPRGTVHRTKEDE